MSKESKIMTAIVAVLVAGLIAVFVIGNKGDAGSSVPNADKLVKSTSHKQGAGAVTVVEFGDYQCPACGQAYPITKQILSNYGDKITFVFRNFPLVQLHKNAKTAAEAAEAAGDQGKFWEMHDKLYENQESWATLADPLNTFTAYAAELGLDSAKFKSAVQQEAFNSIIEADTSDGNDLGVDGTPTFYIGNAKASAFDYNSLKTMIDSALAK